MIGAMPGNVTLAANGAEGEPKLARSRPVVISRACSLQANARMAQRKQWGELSRSLASLTAIPHLCTNTPFSCSHTTTYIVFVWCCQSREYL